MEDRIPDWLLRNINPATVSSAFSDTRGEEVACRFGASRVSLDSGRYQAQHEAADADPGNRLRAGHRADRRAVRRDRAPDPEAWALRLGGCVLLPCEVAGQMMRLQRSLSRSLSSASGHSSSLHNSRFRQASGRRKPEPDQTNAYLFMSLGSVIQAPRAASKSAGRQRK